MRFRQKREIQEKALSNLYTGTVGKKDKDTLVIIPVYNEENTIAQVITSLKEHVNCDILVVDDKSTDSSPEILKAMDVMVVTLTVRLNGNFVVFTALEAGHTLGYDYIIKVDGDGQHSAEDANKILEILRGNSADITIGSRYINYENKWNFSIKNAGRLFSSRLVSLLTGCRITDATSGLRGWNKAACSFLVREFKRGYMSDDFTWDLELCIIALRNGMRVSEVPVNMNEREFGESKEFGPIRKWAWPPHLMLMVLRTLMAFRQKGQKMTI